ncbi:MAG TPA: TetR/AcrR family transcriptional regulator [Acidimicrobiales bacterium]|nr:TetR/AcrR family transcriptional regulator [Acidimicrobiales bacterium]
MTGSQRREQLLGVGRSVFAERGFDGASIEEIASRAGVSKPVVYEHFGGKEGIYAVVVDREIATLLDSIVSSLHARHPRALLEQAVLGLLRYIESDTDGFRILTRDSPVPSVGGNFANILNDVVSRLEPILAEMFTERGYDPKLAPVYAQALVGMVASTGLWWLDAREPPLEIVAAHLVNLAWNGLASLEPTPRLRTARKRRRGVGS